MALTVQMGRLPDWLSFGTGGKVGAPIGPFQCPESKGMAGKQAGILRDELHKGE